MEQRSVEGMGFEEKGRRGRVERISWRFFFRRGSTIDPLNFSLLLAPPTPTAISHLSHSLSLSLYSTLVFLSLCLGLSAVSRFRRDYELCSTQFFCIPPSFLSLFPPFLCRVRTVFLSAELYFDCGRNVSVVTGGASPDG